MDENEKFEPAQPAAEEAEAKVDVAEDKPVSDSRLEELVKFVNDWFIAIRNTVRTVKEKDVNLYKMNSELQAYRGGYSRQLFKSVSLDLINYREDCAKSLRDANELEIPREKLIKYIGYVSDDFSTLLENMGVEILPDGDIKLNGKSISDDAPVTEVFTAQEQPAVSDGESTDGEPVTTFDGIAALLDRRTEEIKKIIADNTVLDGVIKEYIKQSSLIERNVCQIVLYPVIRKLVSSYKEVSANAEEVLATEAEAEELTSAYRHILEDAENAVEGVLSLCDVKIENAFAYGDAYNPARHRLMRTVPTEEADKNGKIAKVYSDAYIMDDKVIYPAKVDVYKTK